jgi:uncharacterized repeat protein (TIGR03803 family)
MKRLLKTACSFAVIVAAVVSHAQTFATLAYFSDNSSIFSSLAQGQDGNLYGTSNNGGTNGDGSVFRVTPQGELTTLYSFCTEPNCADGSSPFSGLALGTDGNFYGTTQDGGNSGLGTVFKITPAGVLTVLHNFVGADGSYPDAGLALGTDGNFHGTTCTGGLYGSGTIFTITSAGAVSTLHNFDGTDGSCPMAALVQGTDGAFYGTTYEGGSSEACYNKCGTVFRITDTGAFISLHGFVFTDGAYPTAPLMQASNGAFYGTTYGGGDVGQHICTLGCGTIYKISSGGTFATLHKFHGSDGGNVDAGLIQATDGDLYSENPDNAQIFRLALPSTITTEYAFHESGGNTALLQASDGLFYGTYESYDVFSAIFSLDIGLNPFVAFVIPTGKAGQTAQILGQGFTGTTSVTFNGVEASGFEVVSDTYMTAVLPSGATSGSVVVVTPSGTLTSNVNFRVAK